MGKQLAKFQFHLPVFIDSAIFLSERSSTDSYFDLIFVCVLYFLMPFPDFLLLFIHSLIELLMAIISGWMINCNCYGN